MNNMIKPIFFLAGIALGGFVAWELYSFIKAIYESGKKAGKKQKSRK